VTVWQAQVELTRIEGVGLTTWAEVSLLTAIAIAVLAFGGTEPTSFAVVEILLAGVAIIFLAKRLYAHFPFSMGMVMAPAVLVGLVLIQLCPLPVAWARRIAAGQVWNDHIQFRTLTIEPFATRAHLLVLLTCIIGFFLAYIASQGSHRKRHFIVGLVVIGLFEAFYGLVQYLTGWQHIFGYVKKYDLEEATGTYINRNHYAGLLEMVFPFALSLAFYEFWKLHTKRRAGDSTLHRIAFWLSIAVVLFAALVYSRSRMGIAAASMSTLVMLVLAWTSRFYGRAALISCTAFLILSAGIVAWIGAASVVERFHDTAQEYAAADHTRISIWRDTLKLIRRNPWLGTGFGTFPIAYTAVQTSFLGEFVNHAHNDYLELASDLGIPAAAELTATLVWLLVHAVRAFRSASRNMDKFFALGCVGGMVAILLHSLVDFNLYIPANALVFASLLGLTMSLKTRVAIDNG
jgi:putative inorganic carbon (HCO3(-)) transporter